VTPVGTRLWVRSYAPGRLRIGDQEITAPVILSAQALRTDFRPAHPEALEEQDLAAVFDLKPEVVLLGWGGGRPLLTAHQRSWFLQRAIGIEAMDLGAACRTYNVLLGDDRAVVALLFP